MNKIILFTLPTCAPCKVLKEQLATEWISKKLIQIVFMDMASDDEHVLNEATKYGIRSAPTAVCTKDDGEPSLFKTFEQIKEFFNGTN